MILSYDPRYRGNKMESRYPYRVSNMILYIVTRKMSLNFVFKKYSGLN